MLDSFVLLTRLSKDSVPQLAQISLRYKNKPVNVSSKVSIINKHDLTKLLIHLIDFSSNDIVHSFLVYFEYCIIFFPVFFNIFLSSKHLTNIS